MLKKIFKNYRYYRIYKIKMGFALPDSIREEVDLHVSVYPFPQQPGCDWSHWVSASVFSTEVSRRGKVMVKVVPEPTSLLT